MSNINKILVGIRDSKLSRTQTEILLNQLTDVADNLSRETFDIKTVKTTGDIHNVERLDQIGGKGLFIKEIEQHILNHKVDVGVHSMKDVETDLPEELVISTILKREDVRDSFISRTYSSIADLPLGSVVGTSSLRRKAQLLNKRKDLKVVEFRGNVQKRLEKLDNNVAVAIFLATAGLNRLGLVELINPISTDEMLPAVAQGAVGIEHLRSEKMEELLAPLNDSVYKEKS